MSRSPLEFLHHILDEIRYLDTSRRALTEAEFVNSETYHRAFSRSFEIIGEATKKLDRRFWESHPEIPWSYMAKMRDKLIHHYFGVDAEMLWQTAIEDVPTLKDSIEKLIKDIEAQ